MSPRDYSPKPRLVGEIISPALTDARKKMIDDAETFALPKSSKRWERIRDRDSVDPNRILEEKEFDDQHLSNREINTYDERTGNIVRSDRTHYMRDMHTHGKDLEYRHTRDYHYHDDGRLFMETQSTKFVDSSGKVNETTGFDHITIHVYSGEEYRNEITDNMWIITHSENGRTLKEQRFDREHSSTREYDERGRPTKSTYAYGGRPSRVTEYSYVDNSDGTYSCTEVLKTYDDNGTEKSTATTQSTYRADGKPLSRVDEEHNLYSFYVYDERGNPKRTITRTTSDHALDVSPRYVIDEYEYDFDRKTHESTRVWIEPASP